MSDNHEHFMALAIEEAKEGYAAGEQPFGAVIAREGEVVCKARSLKVSTSDTTAHAETLAVKYATRKLKQRVITGCTFYATCEPCPMCLGAVLNAGNNTLVMGARNRDVEDLADLAFNFNEYTAERFAEMMGWDLKVIEGVMTDQCVEMYRQANVALTR